MMRSLRCFVVLSLAALTACEGFLLPSHSRTLPEENLTIVRVAADAPPLTTTEVSFWMLRGEERAVEIRYVTAEGYPNGKCVRLVVPADAPLRDAAGRVLAPGDSVRVTLRVLDPALFLFELEPAGLLLNPALPARLEVRYRWMSPDLNGDGLVDETDERLDARFGLWRQDSSSLSWSRVSSSRFPAIQEVHSPIRVFARYALASD